MKEVEILIDGKPVKVRKPRGPSKKNRAALQAARDEGYTIGLNAPRAVWPGPVAALVCAVAAFVAGALLF